ncbi:hypothetical protein [Variovorax sp. 54]|uniref:hypothetical protein n=1 Tax=Variovorax sp. 54 TaxID=2035212 RepID=UPI001180A132|nr:hypothetical protein [Variovorax sp. 54]
MTQEALAGLEDTENRPPEVCLPFTRRAKVNASYRRARVVFEFGLGQPRCLGMLQVEVVDGRFLREWQVCLGM